MNKWLLKPLLNNLPQGLLSKVKYLQIKELVKSSRIKNHYRLRITYL